MTTRTWLTFGLGVAVVACTGGAATVGAQVGGGVGAGSGPASESGSIWAGVYTSEQADQGASVYGRSCSSCHGRTLGGGEDAPGLKGESFLQWWYGKPLSELADLIGNDMPSDNPGGLSKRDYAAVLAYILRENEYPAGEEPLSEDAAQLGEIVIEAEASGE